MLQRLIRSFVKSESADKEVLISGMVIGSRTVVEKNDYVAAGTLRYIEGDLIEIELAEFKPFELGEPVKLTIYSQLGVYRMSTTVIAKAAGAVAVLFPHDKFKVRDEKRSSPRVPVECGGWLKLGVEAAEVPAVELTRSEVLKEAWASDLKADGLDQELLGRLEKLMEEEELQKIVEREAEKREASHNVPIAVRNLSRYGISFTIGDGPVLMCGQTVEVELELSFPFVCTVEIMRMEQTSSGCIYGALIKDIDETLSRALRAYVLREQVEDYYRRKDRELTRQE
ncbi:PilZ domain-containing protein [Paenibacillus beijingensis]|uniref:PilZ domain-containing protein n=1 Tax=Paenibacillus beijingensis TaxID=1126833 RepID=UPI0006965B35|nr:PilZ domain-containing protein [Paenibacillus beijingensis]